MSGFSFTIEWPRQEKDILCEMRQVQARLSRLREELDERQHLERTQWEAAKRAALGATSEGGPPA